jgi:hypothetical protein
MPPDNLASQMREVPSCSHTAIPSGPTINSDEYYLFPVARTERIQIVNRTTGVTFMARLPDMSVSDLYLRLLGPRVGNGSLQLRWRRTPSSHEHRTWLSVGSGSVLEALDRDRFGRRLPQGAHKTIVIGNS